MVLRDLAQADLDRWVAQVAPYAQQGRLLDYIPLLAKVDRRWFAVQIQTIAGEIWSAGETDRSFPLMSVIKPLLLLFLLEHLGSEAVFATVGIQPSDQPFHSLRQLELDQGFPRNPMINSGAIALASLLPGLDGTSRCEALRQWLNKMSGADLFLDQAMLASVRSLGNEANKAISALLAQMGHIDLVDVVLDTYNQICCLTGTVDDLAKLGLILANPSTSIKPQHQRIVNALMLTCGLYEASSYYAIQIGLPTKSGVSGAIVSIVPGQGAIACYSPALDEVGNSLAGMALLEKLANQLHLSIFG